MFEYFNYVTLTSCQTRCYILLKKYFSANITNAKTILYQGHHREIHATPENFENQVSQTDLIHLYINFHPMWLEFNSSHFLLLSKLLQFYSILGFIK